MHHFKTTKPKKNQKLNPPIVEFLFRNRGVIANGFFFSLFHYNFFIFWQKSGGGNSFGNDIHEHEYSS